MSSNDGVLERAAEEITRKLKELEIKAQLLPAAIILSRVETLDEEGASSAAEYARSALRNAEESAASKAVQAKCAYYVGVAEFILAKQDDALSRPSTSSSTDGWRANEVGPLHCFQRALEAKDVYEEGTKAEYWVEHLSAAESRGIEPSGQGMRRSLLGKAWNLVWSRFSADNSPTTSDEGHGYSSSAEQRAAATTSESTEEQRSRRSSSSSMNNDSAEAMRPEYTVSWDSVIQDNASVSSTVNSIATENPAPYVPVDLSTNVEYEDENENGPILPVYNFTSDLSPMNSFHSRAKSVMFAPTTVATSLTRGSAGSHRRSRSLGQILLGGDRATSELEQMEEGHSPYTTTFERSVLKNLKRHTD